MLQLVVIRVVHLARSTNKPVPQPLVRDVGAHTVERGRSYYPLNFSSGDRSVGGLHTAVAPYNKTLSPWLMLIVACGACIDYVTDIHQRRSQVTGFPEPQGIRWFWCIGSRALI